MPRRVLAIAFVVLAMTLTVLVPSSADAARLPSKKKWVADTYQAMYGSRAYVRDRVARSSNQGGTKLALNLDIDNTSLATKYDTGKPVAVTLRLVQYAKSKGVYILFNTGRNVSQRAQTIAGLKRAGYPVDGLCAHYKGEALRHSKQRCRQSFTNNGFTIIANIGNRSTDFVGGNYERAYRLPNYGNRLG
jgi:HAD superfamily, subfamily IIIB (Acid phosphatase)